jgi:hypothetical protein
MPFFLRLPGFRLENNIFGEPRADRLVIQLSKIGEGLAPFRCDCRTTIGRREIPPKRRSPVSILFAAVEPVNSFPKRL